MLIEANILTSADLVRAIVYEWVKQLFVKNENSFRHIGSLMEVDWLHPNIGTFEV